MPSLNRIILIDTHLPGVVELSLEGHTNICGTNASGKTTLQRLVPVFYGEYPSRVVPATRDSFERWYLPRESSYIIYEYLRGDGLMNQAVLSSAGDGKGVNYRIIGKGFELSDYVLEQKDKRFSCHSMAELGRAMKREGISHTKLLNTREYRAIIQNDRSLISTGGNSSELRGYTRQFSLCSMEHSLRHIEKLAKAVHSKEGKMETIKSMIAAILEEDGVEPPKSRLSPAKVEEWLQETQLMNSFSEIRPQFQKLEQTYQELLAGERRLANLNNSYSLDEQKLTSAIESFDQELERVSIEQKLLEERWSVEQDELNQDLSAAKGDIVKFEDELEQIEAKHEYYQRQDIETTRGNLARLPGWQDEYQDLQQRHQLLTEKHSDIEATYNQRCHKIAEQLQKVQERFHGQQQELYRDLEQKNSQKSEELQALDSHFLALKTEGKQQHQQKVHELELKRVHLDSYLKNATFSEEEKSSLGAFDARIKEAGIAQDSAQDKLERQSRNQHQLSKAREQANDKLRQLAQQMSERQSKLDGVNQLLYPGKLSLLEFLRREKPGWESSVGRLIHPELLGRCDLKPALSAEESDSMFGLQLDQGAIELPEYAQSEQQLQAQLNLAEQALQEIKDLHSEAEKELGEANQKVDAAEREVTLASAELKQQREGLRRLLDEKERAQQQCKEALASRKALKQQELELLQQEGLALMRVISSGWMSWPSSPWRRAWRRMRTGRR
ncbi:ATP-binding protein [Dongshaea marina]|uniref:ATP-binding protein n=1 Tax=Dongshaea marina TaxID=2047966 RepID=UPI0019020722|nr:ATP-binding protein [Dongshaea marina]